MEEDYLELSVENVREFREFQRDLFHYMNIKKILRVVEDSKVIQRLSNTRIIFLKLIGTNTIATGAIEEWDIIGARNGLMGVIKAKIIDPAFFLLTDLWKTLDLEQLEKLFEISEEFRKDRKISKFVDKEYRKAVNCLEKEECDEGIDHNVVLFVRKWAIPVEKVRVFVKRDFSKLFNILEKFSQIYENKYPINGIEKILTKIEPWKPDYLFTLK